MTNEDLIFTYLMGAKYFATVERFSQIEMRLKENIFNPEFKPLTHSKADTSTNLEQQFFPMGFSKSPNGETWYFPFEPLVSLNGGFNITKSNISTNSNSDVVFKTGSIKERLFPKDYEISITGIFIGENTTGRPENCYPRKDIEKLMSFLTSNSPIYIKNEFLNQMNVTKIVVEDYSLPFTKGENVQGFDIKCLSDFNHSLIIQ